MASCVQFFTPALNGDSYRGCGARDGMSKHRHLKLANTKQKGAGGGKVVTNTLMLTLLPALASLSTILLNQVNVRKQLSKVDEISSVHKLCAGSGRLMKRRTIPGACSLV